jgi:hypothetical protein
LFLVDGKLVVLQPSTKENGELKYDMRIIAQNVEYYNLMRDQQNVNISDHKSQSLSNSMEQMGISRYHQNDLRDSLWYFDGVDVRLWTDTQELLASTPQDLGRDLPDPVIVPVDFYPLAVILAKGILFGVEPDVMQRRDTGFVVLRFVTRVCTSIAIRNVYGLALTEADKTIHPSDSSSPSRPIQFSFSSLPCSSI